MTPDKSSKHGPNVTKLIIQFIAREAIPPGGGGLANAIEFFKNQEKRMEILAKAEADALQAIRLIRAAPDNPYGDSDEDIAAAILLKVEERKRVQHGRL